MPVKMTINWFLSPRSQWQAIAEWDTKHYSRYLFYPVILALLPAVAWYFGLTDAGWTVGAGETVRLTQDSAGKIIVLFYLAMLGCIGIVGYMVHWMSATYGCETSLTKGIVITGFTATPLFVFGLLGFYPVFWVDLLAGLAAIGWSLNLLYVGIPIAMKIEPERGFFYASAVVAVCLVVFMALMGASVILWDMGAAPVFAD